ncbi:MAG TPA: GIY-YIG nuclease family protein [Candidatus Paceibacterota bacterium]|nr:GIY-YIG nuclease family protein [Candidatus Paceibacterota bacterium]
MTKEELTALKLPDAPGVYLFRGPKREILYIGKAASLRDRVRSYFASDIAETRSSAIAKMAASASMLTWTETGSVLEALILEANLIKQHQPPYNIREKDNKSFNYLVITKEDFPRVLIVRGRDLFQKWHDKDIKKLFGPFPQGSSLKEALKIVRKIFPFRDTCTPCSHQNTQKYRDQISVKTGDNSKIRCKPCFNRQLGLCPGVCSGEVDKKEYAQYVSHIITLFSGNFQGLKRQLGREMKAAASEERFEDAQTLRRQISALEHIRDISLIKDENRISSGGGVRIEAYDTAHTSGTETVAVMTVVRDGIAKKDAYRKFKIKTATNDDVTALKEILSRRLAHDEWPMPRIIVVDGGSAQLRAAERILKDAGVAIPIVGVVKNEAHKPDRLIGDTHAIQAYERDILLANAEAHRFAISWHRSRSRKNLIRE